MENKRLRPVLYREFIPIAFHIDGDKQDEPIEGTDQMSGFERRGYFHRWANETNYNFQGKRNKLTFAIIESYNGQVVKVAPENLKFNDV